MSDYTKPISDDEVHRLSEAIETFADNVNKKIDSQTALLDRTLGKQYTVNHEPKIEFPFDNEYKYVHDELMPIFADKGGLDKLTHIFISGYLPNGKIIKLNDSEVGSDGSPVSKYDSIYINGIKLTGNYICRAEEGGWEKLNIMVVQRPSDTINGVAGRLDIDYADIPLENFKMLIHDDVATPLYPNVDSFIAGTHIDTLKCIGDLVWTCNKFSSLRSLHVTKAIIESSSMVLPCLQEFIAPNVSPVPNINVYSNDKGSLHKIDISNCRGAVANLQNININTDLSLQCSQIANAGLSGAKLNKLDVGNYCSVLGIGALRNATITELTLGPMFVSLGREALNSVTKLTKIIFKNVRPAILTEYACIAGCTILDTINFSYISGMNSDCFSGCSKMANLTFIDDSTSCSLYFQASASLTEQSCLNIINAIKADTKNAVSLHQVVRSRMTNEWYCKLDGDKYVSCESTDEGAITQCTALTEKGWTLA